MLRLVVGGAFWLLLLAATWWGFGRRSLEQNLWGQLRDHAWSSHRECVIHIEPAQALQVGDPVYLWQPDRAPGTPIGRVVRLQSTASRATGIVETDWAQIELYGIAPALDPRDSLYVMNTPRSLGWVIETMLPPESRHKIGEIILSAWAEHREMVWGELRPIIELALRDSAKVIAEELATSWQRHRIELYEVADRYRDEYLERHVLPVLQQVVWPMIQHEMQPLLEQIGLRMWERASVFGFTWRYLYDVSPLPRRDLLRREFQRFVEKDAVPVLMEFTPSMIQAQQRVVEAATNHPRVRDVLALGLQHFAQDVQSQRLMLTIVQEAVISNPRLVDVWRDAWRTPEAQAAFDRIGMALEPSIVSIGELLFGSPHVEITPEFSRVLRNRVLFKDDRWLLLVLADGVERERSKSVRCELTARPGSRQFIDGFNPFHIPATKRE